MKLETRSSQQAAAFHDDVVYYEVYDGVLADESEGEHMAEVLGDKRILMMRNHGAMIVGSTVASAYLDTYQLERACMYQLLAVAGGDEHFTVGAERDAMAVMSFSRNFWLLNPQFFH